MSEKKENPSSQEQDGLDLQDVKHMTVEEVAQKNSEIKASAGDSDGVLDKYIKEHKDEVTSQKFESKISDFDDLDTLALDDFIKKQREELAQKGIIGNAALKSDLPKQAETPTPEPKAVPVEDATEKADARPQEETPAFQIKDEQPEPQPQPEQEATELADIKPEPSVSPEPTPAVSSPAFTEEKDDDDAWGDEEPKKLTRTFIIGGVATLVLAIFGIAYGLNANKNDSKTVQSNTSVTKTSSEESSKEKKAASAFDSYYDSFFTDDKKTSLKNSAFSNLPTLKEKLDALKGTKSYDAAKKDYDALDKQIEAIQSVNKRFESDVIVDGKKVSATVKSDANFDQLSSDLLKTGNAKLDTLLQSAITDGKEQLEQATAASSEAAASSSEAASSSSSSSEAPDSSTEASDSEQSQTEASSTTQEASSDTSTPATASVSGATSYGITSYNPAILQRNLSRVPYNESAIADSSNPAWTFAPGVLEKIIDTSHARGYFSGNDFILEKVNIINDNGYYNMFKADGTYLFSINCKTGYFVGNAAGHSDALDY